VSLVVNVAAAAVFAFSGRIAVAYMIAMAFGALLGGVIGGGVASRVPPRLLRAIVIVVALGMAAVYFARL
jgi:uncharacterized membrane protein YfcA